MLNGGSAVGAVSIKVGKRSLEFVDHHRYPDSRKLSQRAVRYADFGNSKLVFHFIGFGAACFHMISETFAEQLIEELRINGRFFVQGQVSIGLKIGPIE